MFLIQLLIPLANNSGDRFPESYFTALSLELAGKFGGVTAYARSPAVGLWQPDEKSAARRDDIIVYEVFADAIDREWWSSYRRVLESRFSQDELVVRAHVVERL